jgi:tetratricopeptide (TPR) repeat protein
MEMSLAQKAISLAINGEWNEATKVNLEILSFIPDDIDSLNRLAKAFAESGRIAEAKKTAQKVLKIDPENSIAIRCFNKWSLVKNGDSHTKNLASSESFLEDPGKTKIVNLINPGDAQVVSGLDSGDLLILVPHPHSIAVVADKNKYVGKLPDDLAARLKNLIKSGIKYQVLVKSIISKQVIVFIRETERGKKAPKIQSFPAEKNVDNIDDESIEEIS